MTPLVCAYERGEGEDPHPDLCVDPISRVAIQAREIPPKARYPKTPEQDAMPRSLQSPFAATGPSWWAKKGA